MAMQYGVSAFYGGDAITRGTMPLLGRAIKIEADIELINPGANTGGGPIVLIGSDYAGSPASSCAHAILYDHLGVYFQYTDAGNVRRTVRFTVYFPAIVHKTINKVSLSWDPATPNQYIITQNALTQTVAIASNYYGSTQANTSLCVVAPTARPFQNTVECRVNNVKLYCAATFPNGPLYYKFDEMTGNKANDSSSHAQHLTFLNGGLIWFDYTPPHDLLHTVVNISQINDERCIYYGQTPAIKVGDQFAYKNVTETNGWPVAIDVNGFPEVNTGGASGTDSFLFNISRDAGDTWDPVPPASSAWTFTIAAPGPPVLLTVNGGNPVYAGQTNVPFTGTGLGASPAARTLLLTQGSIEVVQQQVSGDANGGVFNVVGYEPGGKLKYGQAEFKVTVP